MVTNVTHETPNVPKTIANLLQQARLSLYSAGNVVRSVLTTSQAVSTSPIDVTALEARVMLSATPLAVPLELQEFEASAENHEGALSADSQQDEVSSGEAIDHGATWNDGDTAIPFSPPARPVERELVFVDITTKDSLRLVDDLVHNDDTSRDFEVIVLDQDRDGIDQITEELSRFKDIKAIHLVAHGEDGSVRLGNTLLSEESIEQYVNDLSRWQQYVTADADLLIYGCDLAATDSGQNLLESINILTGVDVAASDDDTGHVRFGADWELEFEIGDVETEIAFSQQIQDEWSGKLATITVDTFADVVDGGDGLTSLREAILQTNLSGGGDTILLSAGTYTLSITGTDEDGAATGDLDIVQSVTITGTGAQSTMIDGGGIDRVFHTQNTAILGLSNVTVQGGVENDHAGGFYIDDTSVLHLTDAIVQNNDGGSGNGGAFHVHGTLNLNRVLVQGNTARHGAGIHFHNGTAGGSLTNSTLSGNTATDDGGAIWTNVPINIVHSTITMNSSNAGGGIFADGATVTLSNTIVAGNTAVTANDDVDGSFSSDGFNLIEVVGSATGFDNDLTGVNAKLDILADNGGSTPTYALLAGSPAMNAGANFGAPTIDQTGAVRDEIPDIGAYESAHLSTKVYWAETDTDAIYRANADGTAVQQIVAGLDNPIGLEVDLVGGKMYWIESGTNRLHRSNLDGSASEILDASNLVAPKGIGLDLTNGHIYVADDGGGADDAIRRFDLDGGGFTTLIGNLNGIISDVAIDAVGNNAYFTFDNGAPFQGRIDFVDLTGGPVSTLVTGLVGPKSIVIDQPADRIYVSDDGDFGFNLIRSLNLSDGSNATTISTFGLNSPSGIAQDSTTGKVYWSDSSSDMIRRSDLDGSNPEDVMIGIGGPQEIAVVTLGRFNSVPTANSGGAYAIAEGQSLVLDASSSADADGDSLTYSWDLDSDGQFDDAFGDTPTIAWASLPDSLQDDGSYTIQLRVDDGNGGFSIDSGTVNIANAAPTISLSGTGSATAGSTYTLAIHTSDAGHETISSWWIDWGDGTIETINGDPGTAEHNYTVGGLTHNVVVGVTDEDGTWFSNDMFLATENVNPVFRFDGQTGVIESVLGNSTTLDVATDLLIGPDGLLYVAGLNTNNVERFDPSSNTFVDTFISNGLGGLDTATGLAFGVDGNLYVSSQNTDSILRFNGLTGAFIDTFVTAGSGGLADPNGIAFGTDGNLYVAGETSNAIHRYDGTTGEYLDDFVPNAGGPNGPAMFTFGPDGNLYVTAKLDNNVMRYDGLTGALIDEFVAAGAGGLNASNGISFAPDGNLYVSSEGSNSVLRFDGLNGNYIDEFIPAGTNGLNGPRDFVFSVSHQVGVSNASGTTAMDDSFATDEETMLNVSPDGVLANDQTAPPPTPGNTLGHDAGADTNGDLVWDNGTSQAGHDWDFSGGGVTYTNTPTSSLDGISAAWVFDGTGGGTAPNLTSLAGNPTDDSASFEIWFNPSDAIGQEIIFETGGSGQGTSLSLNGSTIELLVKKGSSTALATHDLSAEIAADEFIQVMGTVDLDSAIPDVYLYVNGVQVDSVMDVVGLTAWANAGDSGLGRVNGSTDTLNTSNFEGEIAIFQLYESVLNTSQVDNNYDAVDQASGSGSLTAHSLDTTDTLGLVALNPDGSFSYDPNGQFESLAAGSMTTDTFRYTADDTSTTDVAVVTMTITGVNDAPTDIMLDNQTVVEATAGAIVGNLTSIDPDTGDTHTYEVDDVRFEIIGSQLKLRAGISVDFEVEPTVSLTVKSKDSGSAETDKLFVITVSDTNDQAPVVDSGLAFVVPENLANNTLIGVVSATDADTVGGPMQNWTITAGDPAGVFSINPNTGEITIADNTTLDFETTSGYNLSVTVSDGTNTSAIESVAIAIADVNEAPTVTLTPVVTNLLETFDTGSPTIVARIDVVDDALGSEVMAVAGPDSSMFEIVGNRLVLKAGATLDFDTNPVLRVAVLVDDPTLAGSPDDFAPFVLTVHENPAPVTHNDTYSTGIDQTLAVAPVGGLLRNDVDANGDSMKAVLVHGPSHGVLVLSDNGAFVYVPSEGFEGIDVFVYRAFDGHSLGNLATVKIAVDPIGPATPVAPPAESEDSSSDSSTETPNDTIRSEVEMAPAPDLSTGKATPKKRIETNIAPTSTSQKTLSSAMKDKAESDNQTSGDSNRMRNDLVRLRRLHGDSSGTVAVSFGWNEGAAINSMPEVSERLLFISQPGALWKELDTIRESSNEVDFVEDLMVGTVGGVTSGFTVGYVIWMLRGGVLVSSLMAQLPAWKFIDPIVVLGAIEDDLDADDDESLQSIVDKGHPSQPESSTSTSPDIAHFEKPGRNS